jgi:hypothetical protein
MIRVADIQATVARNFGIPAMLIREPTRVRRIARPRQIAMLLSREMTKLSLPAIAREFRRDHTTVLHGIGAAKRFINDDPELARKVDSIRRVIELNRPNHAEAWRRVFNQIEDPISRKLTILAKRDRGELTDAETQDLINRCDVLAA